MRGNLTIYKLTFRRCISFAAILVLVSSFIAVSTHAETTAVSIKKDRQLSSEKQKKTSLPSNTSPTKQSLSKTQTNKTDTSKTLTTETLQKPTPSTEALRNTTTPSIVESAYVNYLLKPSKFSPELKEVVNLISSSNSEKALATIKNLRTTLGLGYQNDLLFLEGFSYEQLGKFQEAQSSYQQALETSFQDLRSKVRLALVHKKLRKFQEAIKGLKEVAWYLEKDKAEIYEEIAGCYKELGDTAQEELFTNQALSASPTYLPSLKRGLEIRQARLEKTTLPDQRAFLNRQILQDYQNILNQNPEDTEMSLKLASLMFKSSDLLLDGGKLAHAENLASKVVTKSNYKNDAAVKLLFDIYLKKNNFKSAEEILQNGLKNSKNSPLLLSAQRQLEIQKQLSS